MSASLQTRLSNTCDDCKARKVRCVRAPVGNGCTNCLRRGSHCHYGHNKRAVRRREARITTQGLTPQSFRPLGTPSSSQHLASHKLYLDHILEDRQTGGRRTEVSMFKSHEQYVASSSLAFFSESRIRSVSELLGHTRLRDLIETIASLVGERMNQNERNPGSAISFKRPVSPVQLSHESASSYIRAYFEFVHPIYPILERKDFEQKVLDEQLHPFIAASSPFSALYHTVLALGCQYEEGGTFEPGKGKSWRLFQVALGLIPEILTPKETLVHVQAIISMAIYALSLSCLQINEMLISEAARMAQSLGFGRGPFNDQNSDICNRVFWVIYTIEKTTCFYGGRRSVLLDYDIGAPVPSTPDSCFGDFDWLFSHVRFARLLSKMYEMLFSISATLNSDETYRAMIDMVADELSIWRDSIPEPFRPGLPVLARQFGSPCSMLIKTMLSFYFHSALIALARLELNVGTETSGSRQNKSKKVLMQSARTIIELTRYIDTEGYTPIWILGIMPLSALFILFDFVIHNPTHRETRNNLALLNVAAGYFSRLEYATGGSLPASILSEFSLIARQFVQSVTSADEQDSAPIPQNNLQAASLSTPVSGQRSPTSNNDIMDETRSTNDFLFYPSATVYTGHADDGIVTGGFDIMDIFNLAPPDWVFGATATTQGG